MKTPITIITGYLGSGKTTFLRHLLENSGKKIAIVMNEFGKLDIDAKTIKGKNVDIAELTGGCVCCSISGEFELAVKEIIEKTNPDHIFVETTGVVDPESLINDVLEGMAGLRLDSVITIADADALEKYPEIGRTFLIQLEMADIILLNKTDLINNNQAKALEERLRKINPSAVIYHTVRCRVPIELLFGTEARKDKIKTEKGKHLKEENIESFVYTSKNNMDKKKFNDFVEKLPKNIYRAKGFVILDKESYLFNYVNGRQEMEKMNSGKTELVFIGKNILKSQEEVIKMLDLCKS